jgi:hypothetical protein
LHTAFEGLARRFVAMHERFGINLHWSILVTDPAQGDHMKTVKATNIHVDKIGYG